MVDMNHLLLCGKQNSEYAPFVGQPMLAAAGLQHPTFAYHNLREFPGTTLALVRDVGRARDLCAWSSSLGYDEF